MNKKPAHRGATAGLSNAFRQVSTERYASAEPPLQALFVARRFGLTPNTATLVAELAFGQAETWQVRS